MDEWVKEWKVSIVPLRKRFGFKVVGAWVVPEENRFVWILEHAGGGSFAEADRSYYASQDRKAIRPDPARHLAATETKMMASLGADIGGATEHVERSFLDAFNHHYLGTIMEFFVDDCTFDLPRGKEPWGTRFVGKAEVRKGLATRFEGIPDVHYGEDSHWVSGNKGASEWLLTGTTKSGAKTAVRGCDLFEFRDDKILRKDSYWKIVE